MAKEDNGIFGEERNTVTIREQFSKYFMYWPLFVVCLLLCVGTGVIYTRYTVPKYMAVTSFMIEGSVGANLNSEDLIEAALNGKKEVNLNNEIILISSTELMEQTVRKNNLNVSYLKKGKILDIDIYKDAPFTLSVLHLTDSTQTYDIHIRKTDVNGGSFLYGSQQEEKLFSFHWNKPFTIDGQTFVLAPKKKIQNGDGEYIVRSEPTALTAAAFLNNLTVKAFDPKTSVIQLLLKTENLQKGKDILNALIAEFNLADIEDRNKLSKSTVQFIDQRLLAVLGELKGIEGNLENYQGSNQLIDVKGQSAQSLENSNDISKTIKGVAIQQGVASMILDYFTHPVNGSKLVPSSLGLNDATLSTLITQYNELQLKKERETPLVAPNSTVMQDLNTQITNLKSSILESLNNIVRNLKLQESNFQEQNSQYKNVISSIPHNERLLQEIKRKQSITEGLYLYLFQKREEAAISSTAATVSHYKQIDHATAYGPIEPNTRSIILYTAFLGLFLAFGWIYLKDIFNDKISSKEDIIKKTSLPVIGQISHLSKTKKLVIAVSDRNVISEQFRILRTSLFFLLKDKNKKTILITSTLTGEGKSFISLNLAAVIAMPGKKVALLEFDIRQPVISTALNLNNTKGLTNYLNGDVNDVSEIINVFDNISSLHIFPAGPVPLNPADLLLSENLRKLFEILKAEYDYIIIDSPPAGLVSDPFILGEYSDLVLYILRNKKTPKKQLSLVNNLVEKKSLNNVNLILNDIKESESYNYGYGNDYNYGTSNKSRLLKKLSKV